MENGFWDRLSLALRPFLIFGAALSLPVFLISYGYMLRLLFDAVPNWMFLVIAVSNAIVFLGAAQLHDLQQERRSKRGLRR